MVRSLLSEEGFEREGGACRFVPCGAVGRVCPAGRAARERGEGGGTNQGSDPAPLRDETSAVSCLDFSTLLCVWSGILAYDST